MTYSKLTRNQYEVKTEKGITTKVLSPDVLGVAKTFDSSTDPIDSIRKIETGVVFLQSDGELTFTTAASGSGNTYPASFTVDVNDYVILTAVPATGYTFVQWSRNGEVVSTSATARVQVSALADTETSVIYTALFVAE